MKRLSTIALAFIIFTAGPSAVFAQTFAEEAKVQLYDSSIAASLNTDINTPTTIGDWIGFIIRIVFVSAGVIFLILMLYSGFLWMTAGGNEETVKKAKRILVQAIIGVLLMFSAYAITTTILVGFDTPVEPGTGRET
jgi:amino acid transporter